MTTFSKLGLFVPAVLLFASVNANAQDATDDEADVFLAITQQWDAEQKGDDKWLEEMLADEFTGWGKESPAPRNKTSTRKWNKFGKQMGRMIEYELYPLSITVHENVAIAHYTYTSANKDKEGKIEVNSGRFTDVLVRTDDGWQFIAWHGGDD